MHATHKHVATYRLGIFMTQEQEQDMTKNDIVTTTFGDSSLLLRADFDPFLNTLKVYFRDGGVYIYVDTKRKLFNDFRDSESAGKFFVQNIKGQYEHLKLA